MDVEIRLYGRVKQALGERRIRMSIDAGATTGELLDRLEATYDGFDRDDLSGPAGLIVMRGRRHLDHETELADGDVVSISDSPMVES